MSSPAIEVRGLGKRYSKAAQSQSLMGQDIWRALARPLRRLIGGPVPPREDPSVFWALKDIGFSLDRGDSLGVIGANGAGKTTLLRILARISRPTEGEVRLRGRVTPLLGVGTGFVKSLSGRENIFLNASIMGMSRVEVGRRFQEIVDFSGIAEFIDMPVKHYSSGMYARLAFSVAAHIVTDVLLVDEVLSVGDVVFQKKCLDKMGDLMGVGRTVLFVSHSMNSVLKFCRKAIWLDRGRLAMFGDAREVAQAYLGTVTRLQPSWQNPAPSGSAVRPQVSGPGPALGVQAPAVELLSFELLDERGETKEVFFRNEEIRVRARYRIYSPQWPIVPSIDLICAPRHGVEMEVHVLTTYDPGTIDAPRPCGDWSSTFVVPRNLLNDGDYYLSVNLVTPGGKLMRHAEHPRLLSFKVVESFEPEKTIGTVHRGILRPELKWTTALETPLEASRA